VKSNRLFHSRTKKLLRISYIPGQMGRSYFPRKSLKRASSMMWSVDKIALTKSDCGRGVNFIQMTLLFAQLYKLLDALV
jgi:hypothetical protein